MMTDRRGTENSIWLDHARKGVRARDVIGHPSRPRGMIRTDAEL